MKRTWTISLCVLLAVAGGALYLAMAGHAPAGQPPLVEIDSQALSNLRVEFNRAASDTRVILLLSPT